MKNKILMIVGIISASLVIISGVMLLIIGPKKDVSMKVNLMTMSYEEKGKKEDLKVYTKSDFTSFQTDYSSNKLPEVYITEFLFDGVGMYKTYDLDDFIEKGNTYEPKVLETTVLNINMVGTVELVGDLTGMIAINTNDKEGNINVILNGVNIDTDSKKIPAIYVYNKDITYTKAIVTIKTALDSQNKIEGGKLKKVSLIPTENYSDYTNKYSNDNKDNYELYTNYYGVYSASQLDKILFAKVTADNEDLMDGDPYYYYKASGAISSDIDLYFEGQGSLEVVSKNKEGIETKGNLSFVGGTGDYYVTAEDDCLNTTTDSSENANARNTLTIDVNSLYAIVSNDADEGDAIDSNGELIINNGLIVAIAKPGQDSGLDSEKGVTINGGTIIATGDMYDQVSSSSKQNFMVLSFGSRPEENDVIMLLDSSDKVIFSYQTDRTYSYLVYSSPKLVDGSYYLYKNGVVDGTVKSGYYLNVDSYEKGSILAYSNRTSIQNSMMPNEGGQRPEMPGEMGMPDEIGRPEMPDDMGMPNDMGRPEMPENGMQGPGMMNMGDMNQTASNKEFVIDSVTNIFSGVANYSE